MFFVVSLRSAKLALDNCIENGSRQSTHNKYSDKHIFENAFIGVFVLVGLAGFEPAECWSQSPVPYRLAIAQNSMGWIERFELSASRATIWRANQLRYTHHI